MSSVYIEYAKPIDANLAKVKTLEVIDNYRNQQYIYNTIKPTLEKFAGKKLTQRLITALKNNHPEFNCYLRWVGTTQCYLEIQWYDEVKTHEKKCELSLFLGHVGAHSWAQGDNGKGYYTMNMIEQNNVYIFNIDKMIQSMLDGLKVIDEEVKEWNRYIGALQSIYKRISKYEHISTFFKIAD